MRCARDRRQRVVRAARRFSRGRLADPVRRHRSRGAASGSPGRGQAFKHPRLPRPASIRGHTHLKPSIVATSPPRSPRRPAASYRTTRRRSRRTSGAGSTPQPFARRSRRTAWLTSAYGAMPHARSDRKTARGRCETARADAAPRTMSGSCPLSRIRCAPRGGTGHVLSFVRRAGRATRPAELTTPVIEVHGSPLRPAKRCL